MPLSETISCSAGQMQKALQARSCETWIVWMAASAQNQRESQANSQHTESALYALSSLLILLFFLAKNEGAAFALDVHPAVLALWEVSRRRNASTPVQGLGDF